MSRYSVELGVVKHVTSQPLIIVISLFLISIFVSLVSNKP
ncbi:hypothetical protein VCHA47P369_40056 [Vibrio chagasii]|nr:hypothetical protein VCHA40O237_140096 [Vibrio chagasii]CAH7191462.1 hypothetical protein VCHA47P369_40056 [Vibrio chagasii]CAH7213778.1 hypothetical protein VCHA55O508_140096 [Vibrio chagasii]CAH7299568.1 hypothetical protein VCHA48P435_50311 [Vibrio chagasii]CAH7320669.1 hypothetical protein VCHA51O448_50056 [Vibrio chagasii]